MVFFVTPPLKPLFLPLLLGFIVTGGFNGTGCAHRTGSSGGVACDFLGSPAQLRRAAVEAQAEAELAERIDYIPAHAIDDLAQPRFPERARSRQAGPYTLYLTVTIDELGCVSDVARSWQRIHAPSPCEAEFLAAAKTALAAWRLSPAHQVFYLRTPGADDQYLRTETVPETVEIKFTFDPKADA